MKDANDQYNAQCRWDMETNMAENSHNNEMSDISDQVENMDIGEASRPPTITLEDRSTADVPKIIIATNLDDSIFEDKDCQCQFEKMLRSIDPNCKIQYLKSFRRARIEYDQPGIASKARIQLHETLLCGKRLKLYFAQPLSLLSNNSGPTLQPPEPVKQFLISPPASPPVGWKPLMEGVPVINYDLLAALAHLAPGEAHELHAQTDEHPGIIVHICDEPDGFKHKVPILQTKRPEVT